MRALMAMLLLLSCDRIQSPSISSDRTASSRITYDPYASVDWSLDVRLKTQLHDHVMTNESRIRDYDEAGYDVVSLMDYSGVPSLPYTWRERRWPPQDWLSQEFLSSFENIDFLIPNGEEVRLRHMTSPLLAEYIEYFNPARRSGKSANHYSTQSELTKLIADKGGLPILAHPWYSTSLYDMRTAAPHAMEIYNAYGKAKFELGILPTDPNALLTANWDYWLADNPRLFGVAVNDWFGPFSTEGAPAWVIDSGKTIVIAKQANLESFRSAMRLGAMLAIRDFGKDKDRYPVIDMISVERNTITIQTTGAVTWISAGVVVGRGNTLDLGELLASAGYVRAEISDANGSIVYTEPWSLGSIKAAEPGFSAEWLLVGGGLLLASHLGRRSAARFTRAVGGRGVRLSEAA